MTDEQTDNLRRHVRELRRKVDSVQSHNARLRVSAAFKFLNRCDDVEFGNIYDGARRGHDPQEHAVRKVALRVIAQFISGELHSESPGGFFHDGTLEWDDSPPPGGDDDDPRVRSSTP